MKVLVVYGTKSGCTEGIADRIAQALQDAGVMVDVRPAESSPDPAGYFAVVVGSGIRAGRWHASARDWVVRYAEHLKTVPIAFFTCGLTTAQAPEKADEVRACTDSLIEETGVKPVDVGVFAGWHEPKAFPLIERTVLKLMKAPEGDFRDFDAIAAWARETAPRLVA